MGCDVAQEAEAVAHLRAGKIVKLPRCPRVTVSIKSKLHTMGFYQ
jgi:hypothetical protein